MASVSVSHVIMFIASMMIAAAVAGVLVAGVDQVGNAIGDRSAATSDNIRTDVAIISDPGAPEAIYEENDDGTLTVYVKNTGSLNLVADDSQMDVFVNGWFIGPENLTVTSTSVDDGTWPTGSVVEVTVEGAGTYVNAEDGNVDNRVRIIVNGDKETLRFRADHT